MNDSRDDAVAQAIGMELRKARESAGLTRADVVAMLPGKIHAQTLASYERGIRQCPVGRFIKICGAIGVSASDLLGWAMQRAEIDLQTIEVDLDAVLNDKHIELLPLHRWARRRLDADPDEPGIARLDRIVVQQLATMLGLTRPEFVKHLIAFTPQPRPRRRTAGR
ncbi:MAG TPA: helix-turn-helix transcriptional regulator [Actinophytocola sp.]|uniref:helix-turn-helix domain-containing protein n=1 Tax=Actinophytocola sp. TaxID=1872138 RepID=UPI002DDCFBDD|nr:helix-turn-helix transcriptional regulator [Actinophytocola sp.]HEV2783476.1 helix-turn-helix transcriptional regulator [Actinophytocola sp.]